MNAPIILQPDGAIAALEKMSLDQLAAGLHDLMDQQRQASHDRCAAENRYNELDKAITKVRGHLANRMLSLGVRTDA